MPPEQNINTTLSSEIPSTNSEKFPTYFLIILVVVLIGAFFLLQNKISAPIEENANVTDVTIGTNPPALDPSTTFAEDSRFVVLEVMGQNVTLKNVSGQDVRFQTLSYLDAEVTIPKDQTFTIYRVYTESGDEPAAWTDWILSVSLDNNVSVRFSTGVDGDFFGCDFMGDVLCNTEETYIGKDLFYVYTLKSDPQKMMGASLGYRNSENLPGSADVLIFTTDGHLLTEVDKANVLKILSTAKDIKKY